MKRLKSQYIFRHVRRVAAGLIGCCLLTACSDWFDVAPKTDLTAEKLYSTESGFESALTGIYLSMVTTEAYGGNMSFGLLDQLAQEYDYLPDGAVDQTAIYNYATTTSAGFATKQKLAQSWLKLYNVISNCNNFLKWLDSKGDQVIRNENTRNSYRAEALAIRAYCHFDLLRAWGPWKYGIDAAAASTKSIPYRVETNKEKMPLLPAKDVIEKVLKDLTQAKELLTAEKTLRLEDSNRRFRFNYHAVNALLARVYCYVGDAPHAIACAQDVIDHCGLLLSSSNQDDPILFSECLVALNMYHMQETTSRLWADGDKFSTQYFIRQERFDKYFEVSGTTREDMRTKSAAFYEHSSTKTAISRKYNTNPHEAVPLIRLPEMYFILCEMTNDMTASAKYLNLVRNKRGYSKSVNVSYTNAEGRLTALNKEFRKEFYAEGQYWFFLKRHGITQLPYAQNVELSKERFVFPLPDAEKEYGWTAASEQ
ncbi:RagB/SusD family nutrient uptake outer membrane protein [Prevotella salivae]|uniref:RagB/SusD family nutrient uptake outer membrane protein n=1 Tax=Segatella salivae TaxID=228604 RepID=A0AAW4NMB3_9BACT|nr:RagB/SusD family nutrient uptake outer membrane protein [Segatella salivae]MBW4865284.1 RagB/SusD family nutrient uptake outer membrane protein [Segatella salivae]MBW4906524.1 RagB/SusD family nutrient uptake outer membrane protein [Segatella salivae]MBW4909366.1 RagB/SusD family nutrient uptake outer membrane protein [Segatella salivae]